MSKKGKQNELSPEQAFFKNYFSSNSKENLITKVLQDCSAKEKSHDDPPLPEKSFIDDLNQGRKPNDDLVNQDQLETLNTYARLFPTRPYTALIEYTDQDNRVNLILNTSEKIDDEVRTQRTEALEKYCVSEGTEKQQAKIDLYKALYKTKHPYILTALHDYKKILEGQDKKDESAIEAINELIKNSRNKEPAIDELKLDQFNTFVENGCKGKHDFFPEDKHAGLLEIIAITRDNDHFDGAVGNIPHVEMKGIRDARKMNPKLKEINLGLAPYTNYSPSTCGGCSAEITGLEAIGIKVNVIASAPQSLPNGNYQFSENTLGGNGLKADTEMVKAVMNSEFMKSLYARAEYYSRREVAKQLELDEETIQKLRNFNKDLLKINPDVSLPILSKDKDTGKGPTSDHQEKPYYYNREYTPDTSLNAFKNKGDASYYYQAADLSIIQSQLLKEHNDNFNMPVSIGNINRADLEKRLDEAIKATTADKPTLCTYNIGNSHWVTFAVVEGDDGKKTVLYKDSKGKSNATLEGVLKEKGVELIVNEKNEQISGVECGIFALENMHIMAKGLKAGREAFIEGFVAKEDFCSLADAQRYRREKHAELYLEGTKELIINEERSANLKQAVREKHTPEAEQISRLLAEGNIAGPLKLRVLSATESLSRDATDTIAIEILTTNPDNNDYEYRVNWGANTDPKPNADKIAEALGVDLSKCEVTNTSIRIRPDLVNIPKEKPEYEPKANLSPKQIKRKLYDMLEVASSSKGVTEDFLRLTETATLSDIGIIKRKLDTSTVERKRSHSVDSGTQLQKTREKALQIGDSLRHLISDKPPSNNTAITRNNRSSSFGASVAGKSVP